MSMRGLIHHIDLTVSDKGRSRPFYDAVLGFLGYRRSADNDRGSDWDRDGDPFHSIGIVEARGQGAARPHDRTSPGLHHLAWAAESREDVAALHDLLSGHHPTILPAPAAYPRSGPPHFP